MECNKKLIKALKINRFADLITAILHERQSSRQNWDCSICRSEL